MSAKRVVVYGPAVWIRLVELLRKYFGMQKVVPFYDGTSRVALGTLALTQNEKPARLPGVRYVTASAAKALLAGER